MGVREGLGKTIQREVAILATAKPHYTFIHHTRQIDSHYWYSLMTYILQIYYIIIIYRPKSAWVFIDTQIHTVSAMHRTFL